MSFDQAAAAEKAAAQRAEVTICLCAGDADLCVGGVQGRRARTETVRAGAPHGGRRHRAHAVRAAHLPAGAAAAGHAVDVPPGPARPRPHSAADPGGVGVREQRPLAARGAAGVALAEPVLGPRQALAMAPPLAAQAAPPERLAIFRVAGAQPYQSLTSKSAWHV